MWLLPQSHKLVQLGTLGGGGGGRGGGGGGGGVNNLQRFEAYDPLALKGGGDPMVAGHCWLVKKDTGANAKRKENQSSSSFGKKEKTSVSYGFQRWGHDYQGQGRVEASS